MIPHRKNPQLQQSSRVDNNIGSSRPTTSLSFVSSSLNPNRNTISRKSNTARNEAEDIEGIPVAERIREFEDELNILSYKVSSFKEDDINQSVDRLICINESINGEVQRLKENQELAKEYNTLEKDGKELDLKLKNILQELVSCRSDLKKLPTRSQKKDNLRTPESQVVDVREVLKYAMRLAKFTKRSPAVMYAPFLVHPNNYVWPAEDSLRKGMLALCSLKEKEIIEAELGEELPRDEYKQEEDDMNAPIGSPTMSGQPASGEKDNKENGENKANEVFNLDLFDPEEDDDSD